MLELTCVIIPLYITDSVSFILSLHLWYWGAQTTYHDVRVIIFVNVPNIVVEETSLGHLECCTMWDVNEKFIPILTVLGH